MKILIPLLTFLVNGDDLPEDDLLPTGVTCQANFLQPGQKQSRIVGGQNVAKNSWSWIVEIQAAVANLKCYGSFVNSNWVVTAGHCCNRPLTDYVVRSGVHNISDEGTIHEIKQLITHEEYSSSTLQNDICLIELKDHVEFNLEKSFVCLGDPNEPVEETKGQCFVAGGGKTEYENGENAKFIQSIRVNVFSHAECLAGGGYRLGHINDFASFCAGYIEGGKDACTNDSGGPLICINDQNEPVLQGLVSWGVRCALEKYPGIYTRVGSYLDWISQKITGKSLVAHKPSVKLPDSIFVQTLDILGQARTVQKRTNGRKSKKSIPMIPIRAKSADRIQYRVGRIQDRLGRLVTAMVGSESVDFTQNRKCIGIALKSNDPTKIMLEITKQLNEDDAKIQSGFFSVLENVENGQVCDFVASKITLLHKYARNTLHKCSAGYELDGNEKELIRWKKGIEALKTFLLKKLQCSITSQ